MPYNVYRVSYAGMPRDHQAIFVETNDDQSGHTYQVTGTVQNGMTFEDEAGEKPEESPTFRSKDLMGTVTAALYPRIKDICSRIPPPKKQFEGPRRLYPQEPLRRCQEWTAEALQALVREQVMQQ